MKKICLINIWMGPFHNFFPLWYLTASKNATIDFYIISDNKGYIDKENLHFIYMNLKVLKSRIQSLFPFRIKLNSPYKLCDYKPVWGLAFPELVKDYDYWGHCDCDLIFGNIREFISEEMLSRYDKILDAGNFVLYRNTKEMRQLFKKSMNKENKAYPYKAAFQCNYSCYFDEYMGMNILGWQYCDVLRDQTEEKIVFDFSWQKLNFESYITGKSYIGHWKDGQLYRYTCNKNGKLSKEEANNIMLMHIQKRKMKILFSMKDLDRIKEFWIVPNYFTQVKPQGNLYTKEECRAYTKKIKILDRKRSLRNLMKNGIVDYIPHFIRSRRIRNWIMNVKNFF